MYFENESGYLKLLKETLKESEIKTTRNGVVYSKFGCMIKFNDINNFPLLTTKKMFLEVLLKNFYGF